MCFYLNLPDAQGWNFRDSHPGISPMANATKLREACRRGAGFIKCENLCMGTGAQGAFGDAPGNVEGHLGCF